MRYAKILNGAIAAYPYGGAQFQADNPYTNYGQTAPDILATFPLTDLAKQGYSAVEVVLTAQPTFDPVAQSCNEGVPSLVSGVWTQTWVLAALPAATVTANQAAAALATRAAAKAVRQSKVDVLLVTTASGNVFNGDEASQDRMARAIIALNAQPQTPTAPTITWVLANNTAAIIAAAELTQALALAGAAQAAVWVI